ncbi:MAG: hypothetical protein AB7S75_18735, partial [Desulfococcaceae bacterium]
AVHKEILSLNIVIFKFIQKIIIQIYLFVKYEYYNSITCVALPQFFTAQPRSQADAKGSAHFTFPPLSSALCHRMFK